MLEHACRDVAIGMRRETRITYATYRRVTRKVRCDGARMIEALLFSGKAVNGLTTRDEKRRLFRQIGIDVLIEFPLTFQTAAISPEDFLRVIVQEQFSATLLAAGTD